VATSLNAHHLASFKTLKGFFDDDKNVHANQIISMYSQSSFEQ
jgi:hypothetical protein